MAVSCHPGRGDEGFEKTVRLLTAAYRDAQAAVVMLDGEQDQAFEPLAEILTLSCSRTIYTYWCCS